MPIETARIDFRHKPKLSEEIKSLSDAEIESRAKADKDSPPLSDEELANLAPATPRPLRDALGLTQEEFANLFQIPASTIRDWEQGRVRPDAAGRALLKLIAASPMWAASVFSDDPLIRKEVDLAAEIARTVERQFEDVAAIRQETEKLLESTANLVQQASKLGSRQYTIAARLKFGEGQTAVRAKRPTRTRGLLATVHDEHMKKA